MLKRAIFIVLAVAMSGHAAAKMEGYFTIVSTLQDKELYGGCMARLSGGGGTLTSLGYNCPSDPYVTFDCKGLLGGTKADGLRNFDAAQLAMVSGARIQIAIDDTKKINGFCYSRRVDVFAP